MAEHGTLNITIRADDRRFMYPVLRRLAEQQLDAPFAKDVIRLLDDLEALGTTTRIDLFQQISAELDSAYAKHGSAPWGRHEFYAILLEEVEETWDAIKADEPLERVAREAIQVAAMCIRYMETGDRYQGAIGRVQSREGGS